MMPSRAAIRQRRYRDRQRRGVQLVTIEVDNGLLEALIDRGFLQPNGEDDPECIARAVRDAALGKRPLCPQERS